MAHWVQVGLLLVVLGWLGGVLVLGVVWSIGDHVLCVVLVLVLFLCLFFSVACYSSV